MGSCDWAAIRTLRNHLHIPVFANGGVACRADADRCMAETGVNGVMVGEALLENPALFTNGTDTKDGHEMTVVGACGGVERRRRSVWSTWSWRRSILPSTGRSRRTCSSCCTARCVWETGAGARRRSSRRRDRSWRR